MESARRYNHWLFDRARPYFGHRVLDVGAGLGTFTALLADVADEVVALEPDSLEAKMLRARFVGDRRVTVLQGTASDLGVDEPPFSAAICFNVLEHISDDVETLESIRARLEPGGYLLLLVPAHPSLYGGIDRALDHVRRYSRATLRAALQRSQYEIVDLRHVNPIGAFGWFVSSRVLRRQEIPKGPLTLYDRLVPVLRVLDRVPVPIGLSLWAVARSPTR